MEEKIYLNDILNMSDEDLKNCKIRFISNWEENGKKIDLMKRWLMNPEEINTNDLFYKWDDSEFYVR